MNILISCAVFLIMIMCSCDYIAQNTKQELNSEKIKNTYFIQLEWACPGISNLRQILPLHVEKILKEELQLKNVNSLLLKKDRQPLSLYYLNDMDERGEPLIVSALEKAHKQQEFKAPQNITITSKIDFFGEWNDEIVMVVSDPHSELKQFNLLIKELIYTVDDAYNNTHKHALFDRALSERFPFVPHIGLGRLRSNSIKKLVKDASQAEKTLDCIKKRVKDVTLKLIRETISSADEKITFDKLVLFSLTKHVSIQEFSF